MAAIKKWYPNAPNYIIYKRSNWGLDPYALGSYPFLKAGATPQDCVKYQEYASTGNKLFFGGDGVSCTFIGTTHGAFLTGVEAAKRAIQPGTSTAFALMASIFSVFTFVLMFTY
jgi:hypothetical protein